VAERWRIIVHLDRLTVKTGSATGARPRVARGALRSSESHLPRQETWGARHWLRPPEA
jgi:hypothetical protein